MSDYDGLSLLEAAELIRCRKISSLELTKAYLNRIETRDKAIGAFITVDREGALRRAAESDARRDRGMSLSIFDGIPYSVKDNFCTSDMPTTCASNMLSGYIPPYNASVIQTLRASGAVLLGKNNMDEFAMGTDCTQGAFKPCKNPHDLTRIAGGSSGGSAASVAADMSVFSIGSDSGGSVRLPAAHCGVVGLKPTYGAVSRYGLVAYASSLDTVGTLCKSIADTRAVFDLIRGRDVRDSTSFDMDMRSAQVSVRGLRVAVPQMLFENEISDEIKEALGVCADLLRRAGAVVEEISMPSLANAVAAYYIIAMSEASSNLARYDGIRFGHRSDACAHSVDEFMSRNRGEGFGVEVKRRIIAGTYFLSKQNYERYYLKAQRIRAKLKAEISEIFKDHAAILSPVSLSTARKADSQNTNTQTYREDALTAVANLAGIPAISVPYPNAKGMPVGMQLMAACCREDVLFALGEALEIGGNTDDI